MKKVIILAIYIILFWLLLPGILVLSAVYLDDQLAFGRSASSCKIIPGILVLGFAVPLLAVSIMQFRRFSGKYPVSADPPSVFIRNGLYSVWRHPIYLFYTLVLIGAALVWGSRSMLLITLPGFIVLEIIYILIEEKILLRRFGESYFNYRKITPVVIPRFYYWLKIPGFFLFRRLFSYSAHHRERIPDSPPFFIVSSHRNYLDPFFLAMALPFQIRNITTFEMFRTSKTRWFFRALRCIPKKRHLNDMSTGREILRAIKQDAVIGIFPEGERAWTGTINRLKPETLNLFHKFSHVPILPVKLKGNFHAWPRWGKGLRRARVMVSIQEAINVDPAWDLKEIEDRLIAAIDPGDLQDPEFFCTARNRTNDLSKVIYRCPACQAFSSIKAGDGEECKCEQCGAILMIDERYNLLIKNGKKELSGSMDEIYKMIRIRRGDLDGLADGLFPEAFGKYCRDDEYIISFSREAGIYRESFPRMEFLFNGSIVLTSKRLVFDSGSDSQYLYLQDLSSVTIEGNYKLQLYDSSARQLYQTIFNRESALLWQDLISQTMEKELGRMPNTR